MAKSLVTDSGTLYRPGAYSDYKVKSSPSGLATTGVLMLVGEADAGPVYSLESDLESNAYGPDQLGDVEAKYGSGPLVDAFRAACAPADDPDITGSFSSAILVKTNSSAKASNTLPAIGGGTYATLLDRSYGKSGNGIAFRSLSAVAEAVPTTGAFTYIPAVGIVDYRIRSNGGVAVGTSISANTTPTALVTLLDALAGVVVTGGASRNLLTAAGGRTLTIDAFPTSTTVNTVLITCSGNWDNTPVIGDTLVLPSTAPAGLRDPAAGATDENVGAYVITGASATTITAVKLSDAGRTGAVAGTITAPADVAVAVAIAAATDLVAYAPVTITQDAAAVVSGYGKSLEIAELTTAADLLSRTAYVLGTTTAVTWISTTAVPTVLTSSAEYQVQLDLNRTSTLSTESFTAGGDIALKIGYAGTTATMTLTDTALTTTVTGGSGANLSLTLADYASIQAMVDYIASQPGYTCSVGTASLGQLPLAALDNVSAVGICGQFASTPGRIKTDAYSFFDTVNGGSALVQVNDPAAQAASGLPDVMAIQQFLSGGTRGGTTDAQVTAAMTALESVQGNFVVPLFSRNATADIIDGLTDESSTYTIASIHAATRSHVLALSTLKRRRNRQAFLSIAADFATAKNTSANIASLRSAMAFQDFRQNGSNGVQTYLPWMGAVIAAAMQAAGFYRNIEFKGINTVGILSRSGDFNYKSDSQVESALKAGLLTAVPARTGGFIFISDQTTYGKDNNFVFNSIQAVYAADTVSLTMAQRMETAFVGQSVADVSAPIARAFAEGVLADMLRLKLIAPSDGAEKGWKNLSIKIRGNAMLVSVEIKLATAIDFIKIDFLVSQVEQSA
jgi:hypothetical protein